jgi:hypothetical protein
MMGIDRAAPGGLRELSPAPPKAFPAAGSGNRFYAAYDADAHA